MNAVYAFLRELGVRWYMPGPLGEILPQTPNIALPQIDRTAQPEYEVRSISRPLLSSNEIEDSRWYLRIGANDQYGVLHHGQRNLTEHPKQRAAHPEYYVQRANGKRDNVSATANACLSSAGFFKETVAFCRLLFDHYDVPIVSVMPHDGFTHCRCEQCRDQITLDRGPMGQSSDYVWNFVVRVANELAKTHPDRKVFCGAYSTYRLTPRTIDKLPPNVWVQITNDPAIWQGEHLELLIETDQHSYYQIVLNPAGARIDLDRGVAKSKWYDWSSQAEVATHIGDDYWSVEMKLPITKSDEDPLHQIVGTRPFQSKQDTLKSGKGTSLPWYFNLYRKRAGSEDEETTAFSPLGPEETSFHVPLKFGQIYVR
ncbi:MAG: hypothetical protein ACJASX_001847 [Limisphaerales bacterium]